MATLVSGSMVTDGSINAADIAAGAIPTKLGSEIGAFNFRNRLINGDFKFDARAGGALVTYTGTAATPDLYRSADRWAMFGAGDQTQVQRIANTDTVSFPTAMRLRRVNGSVQQSSLYLGQVIERANCTGLAGKPITLSFYARRGSSYSGTNNQIEAEIWTGTNTDDRTWWQHLNLQWENQARPLVRTPVLTTSWQKFTYTLNSLASNVQQIMVRFSAFQSGTSALNDYVDIAQVQLEEGTVATPFEERPIGLELSLCQRYYEVVQFLPSGITYRPNGDTRGSYIPFRQIKRATPSLSPASTSIQVLAFSFAGQGVNLNGTIDYGADTNSIRIQNMGNHINIGNAAGGGEVFAWADNAIRVIAADAEL
jgi:hypothetical protein